MEVTGGNSLLRQYIRDIDIKKVAKGTLNLSLLVPNLLIFALFPI